MRKFSLLGFCVNDEFENRHRANALESDLLLEIGYYPGERF